MQLDTLGVSLGLGLDNELGEVTFGLSGTYRDGQTVTRNIFGDLSNEVYEKVAVAGYGVTAFIGGAIDVGEFSEWTKAMKDPSQLFDVETKTMSAAELDPRLGSMALVPELAPLRETQVEYMVTGVPEYDGFFQRAARIRLAMELTPPLVTLLDSSSRATLAAWGNRPDARLLLAKLWMSAKQTGQLPPEAAQLPAAQSAANTVYAAAVLQQVLAGLSKDIAELPASGQMLVEKAQDQFTGPGLALLPAVLKSLGQAQSNLALAINRVPELAESIETAFGAFSGTLILPEGGLTGTLGMRALPLSALAETLQGDQGYALYDSTVSNPVTQKVSGVESIDAPLFQAARVRLALNQAKHVHATLRQQVMPLAPQWKQVGRVPSQIFGALIEHLASGALSPPPDLQNLTGVADVYRTLLSVRATSDACHQLLAETAELSAQLSAMAPALLRAAGPQDAAKAQPLADELTLQASQVQAARAELDGLLNDLYRVEIAD
jgi:hypothetical protein